MPAPRRIRPAHPDALRVLVPTALASRLTRRSFLSATALLGGSAALAGCGSSTGAAGGGSTDGELEDELSIYTWGEYDDPEVIEGFSAEVGPAVTLDNYGSNEEMIAKLVAANGTSGYDIIVPSSYYIQQMAQQGLLMELDHELLPNMASVNPAFLDMPSDPGNRHTVIKNLGTTGFAYDTTVITRELSTWADFWDAAQKEASGSFSLLEDPGEVVLAYFNANGIDENTEEPADYDAAEEFLVDTIAQHVQAFESYPGTTVMPSNGRVLVQAWNGDARLGKLENSDPERYRWVLPAPSNRWQDNWAIPAGAPHPVAAHAFINHVLDPAVSVAELLYIGYDTGVEGVQEAAVEQGVELPEIIFTTPEQLATLTEGVLHALTPRQTEIVNAMRAAAGA